MKKRKLLHIVLSLVLAVTLIINLTSMGYGMVDISKITNTLQEKMTDNTSRISVSIWCSAPDISRMQALVQASVAPLSESAELMIASDDSVNNVAELSKEIKESYRASVSQIYKADNEDFVSDHLNAETVIYVSRYAPMIIANLTNEEILTLTGTSAVISLDYYEEPEFETVNFATSSEVASELTTLTAQLSDYTGTGVNIGVFDAGIPSDEETVGMNVVATLGEYNGAHPGFVASILKEIAPSANYYFAGNAAGVSYAGCIEWLLDQGVDVINTSLSVGGDGNSVYGNFAKWLDHIAYNHYVLLVKSAGNTSALISCPGMAYNIMTVGAMKPSGSDYVLESFSGYYTGNTYASKPDICAIGTKGTSEATPRVTATAALLIQLQPLLIYSPESIKAILAASVDTSTSQHYVPTQRSTSGTNYLKAGAGLMSTANALELESNNQSRCSTLTASKTTQTYTFTISNSNVGSTVRVALAYCVPVDAVRNHTSENFEAYTIPNLDLRIYAPGNSTASYISGSANNNNVEIIEFTPEIAGSYTIEVATISGTDSTENIYFGVAWSIQ